MQRDTLNTFICAHFTIMKFERIGVFHILFFFSLTASLPCSLPHSVFHSDTFMECSVYCIITRGEATDLQHLLRICPLEIFCCLCKWQSKITLWLSGDERNNARRSES